MAVVGADPQAAERIRELDKRHVLHSWSVQNAINPLPVAGAEGRYFWDYDGNRYLDFASQLVNVSIGHQHPKVVAAIKEQARAPLHDRPGHGRGEPLRAGAAARRGHARRPDDVVLHQRRRRGERERDQARALGDRPPQDHRALPLLPRRDRRRDHAHRRPAPLARRARHPGRRAHARPVHVPLPGGPPRPVPGLHRRAAPRGDPPVRGRRHRGRRDPGDDRRDERHHRPARRLPPGDPRGLRPPRDPADLRRGHGRLRPQRASGSPASTGTSSPTSSPSRRASTRATSRSARWSSTRSSPTGCRTSTSRAGSRTPATCSPAPRPSPRSRRSARRASSRTRPRWATTSRPSCRSSPSATRRSATSAARGSSGASSWSRTAATREPLVPFNAPARTPHRSSRSARPPWSAACTS